MARLHEYQGKECLRQAGIAVPNGAIASTPVQARKIAERIARPVAIKAQVWTTGRFKAGAIKFANSPGEAERNAAVLLGTDIKGFRVEKLLVEDKLDIESEFYAGVIVNNSYTVRAPVIMFSTQGGVDIEETAQKSPDKIARLSVDILQGVNTAEVQEAISRLGMSPPLLEDLVRTVANLYQVFRSLDARSAEINPLVLTKDGKVVAVDCRISIDDASVVRHPELGITVPRESDTPPTPLDRVAWSIEEKDYRGVSFFAQMASDTSAGGYIGYHAIGGGGALLAADALARHGLKLANYAETSGNPTAAKVYRTAKTILSQPALEGYCLLGAVIASQNQWHHAHGLVKAFNEMLVNRPCFPLVILVAGNKETETLEILREGLKELPVALELYGRDYIQRLDFVAERMKILVEAHRTLHVRERLAKYLGTIRTREKQDVQPILYNFRTGSLKIDRPRCAGCTTYACTQACANYGAGLLQVLEQVPSFKVPLTQVPRLCTECLACEYECQQRGQGALGITLALQQ